MKQFRVIVVGGGIIGAAVFQRLSRRYGGEVLMIEKSRPGIGATAFSGGIVRAFHLDEALADLCARGLQFYRELARTGDGEFHIHPGGFLQLIDEAHEAQARRVFTHLSLQVELEWLDIGAARQRFGLASGEGLCAAVFEPGAGHVDPLVLARVLTRMGECDRGVAMTGVELHEITLARDAVCGIATNIGAIACEQLVLCTGAWTPALGQRLGVSAAAALRSKAIQVSCVSRPPEAHAFAAFVDLSSDAYGRPNGTQAALIGCPVDEWDIDPELMTTPTEHARADALARAQRRFAWLNTSQCLGGSRRHDAYDASGRGVVAWDKAMRGVLTASGFSGNGVKLAPTVAESVAALVQAQHIGERAA